jgi:uncharacterized protein YndB with AHSA1/START domain
MEDLNIKNELIINAPLPAVWEALVNPEHTKKYMFNTAVKSNWKKGSEIAFMDHDKVVVRGKIKDIMEERFLQYTTHVDGTTDIPENYLTVTYSLSPLGERTKLLVTQGNFGRVPYGREKYEHSVAGWKTVLAALKEVAEHLNLVSENN